MTTSYKLRCRSTRLLKQSVRDKAPSLPAIHADSSSALSDQPPGSEPHSATHQISRRTVYVEQAAGATDRATHNTCNTQRIKGRNKADKLICTETHSTVHR